MADVKRTSHRVHPRKLPQKAKEAGLGWAAWTSVEHYFTYHMLAVAGMKKNVLRVAVK